MRSGTGGAYAISVARLAGATYGPTMSEPGPEGVRVGDLSPDHTHYWEGDLWRWQPLWLAPEDVARATRECYRRAATSVSFLPDGLLNQSWRVEAGGAAYVLRVSRPERSRQQIAYEHAFVASMRQRLSFVVAPLAGADAETVQYWRGKQLSLFPFVHGAAGTTVPAEDRGREAAAALAQIHRVSLDELNLPQRAGFTATDEPPRWIWSEVRPLLARALTPTAERDELFAVFDREIARLDTWLDDLHGSRRPLPRATIHGDYNPRNMIFGDRQLRGVVDWDNCHLDTLAYEVAAAAFTRVGVAPATFWRTYLDSGGPLTADDVDLLGEFARMDTLAELQWALHDGGVVPTRALELLRDLAAGLALLRDRETDLLSLT